MKLENAIAILAQIVHEGGGCFDDDDIDAFKLGIEAMKHLKVVRALGVIEPDFLLPEETSEKKRS